MALVLKDRVRESSTTSGTGSITLAGAYTGYQSFATAITSGSTVYYTIHNTISPNDGEWEVGVGTFTAPSTLSRDTVFSSSTGGTKVSFSGGASVLEVFITQPAEEAVYINQATGKVEAFGNGANTIAFTNINASNVVMVSGTISTNAANATDITNKTYVDNLFSTGITYHAPVLVESPTALTATYNQPGGAGNGVGATLTNSGANVALSIDGVSLSNTARVLVYTQSNAVQNGVYTVTNPGNVSAQWVLTRATDADTYGVGDPNKLGQGDAFFVQSGNTGAGETYILNTVGTITFGTTNLTFAQISSAQVYSAGTGLNLTNLAFSVANTAVTAAQYGNDGAVGQFTVNAQGQLTNAANVSINASSISVGTLANGRTTAASANGASTIVARDANGNFTANVITATTSNATTFNGTTGNFTNVSGNGVALTAINASNISSGTIANARTTASDANSASTLVVRDANGSFGANIITATFSGNGATLSAINASNISSGTIANARTTAASANGASTIVQRDAGGNFSANTVTAAVIGDLSGGSNINASNIASGTIANARTTAATANGASTIVLRGASGEFAAGAITGTSFSGNGSALTAINATAITSGTLDNARTNASSANGASTLVVRDANGSFAGNVITGTTGTFTSVSGNGVALTAINASNIASGTIANARTTASDANGASTIVSRDANGSFAANVITATTISGNGASLTNINASNISSGTIANARTTAATANGASTIVLRGASGEFSAGAITGVSFTGDGAAISAINASNVSTGTIANARTTGASANGASTLVLRDANGSFAGNVITGTTGTFTNISGNGVSLTAINASNITSGTIDNARTTAASANGASTIVSRDANGSFTANVVNVTTLSGGAVSGNGSALTAINASNVSTGTIANARTTASDANGASTIVARDAAGNFAANTITANLSGTATTATTANALNTANNYGGLAFTASSTNGYFLANRSAIANQAGIQFQTAGATNWYNYLDNGTNILAWYQTNTNSQVMTLTQAGVLTAISFSGNGAAISAINASNVSTGTIANARTTADSANGASTIVARDANGSFTANVVTATTFSGSGASLTSIPNSATTAASANGASTIVARDANGSFTANVVTATNFSGDGASISAINGSNVTTGTVANARTTAASANGASTIVARGTSGEFSAGAITSVSISGNGVALTAINASNIASGTIANARTTASDANGASTIVARSAAGSFAGNVITATTGTFTSVSGNGVALTAINASNVSSGTLAVTRGGTGVTTETGTGANVLNNSPQLTLPAFSTATVTPAGSTQATATLLAADINYVTTTTTNTGVRLPTTSATQVGRRIRVYCTGNNPLRIYPQTSGFIDNNAINVFTPIVNGSYIDIVAKSTTEWIAYSNTTAADGVGGSLSVGGVYSYAKTNDAGDGSRIRITTNDGTNTANKTLRVVTSGGNTTGVLQIINSAFSAAIFELFDGGNLVIAGATATKASGTTWANPSDIRLKYNIQNYTGGIAQLMQVNPKIWDYNGKGGTTAGSRGLGVIADEIESVLPNTVDTYNAKLNNDDEERTDIKRFDATEITWLLVNSVKELKAELDAAKAEIAELKAK
jgi:hypothetical protein